jgi:hypothetical protein
VKSLHRPELRRTAAGSNFHSGVVHR